MTHVFSSGRLQFFLAREQQQTLDERLHLRDGASDSVQRCRVRFRALLVALQQIQTGAHHRNRSAQFVARIAREVALPRDERFEPARESIERLDHRRYFCVRTAAQVVQIEVLAAGTHRFVSLQPLREADQRRHGALGESVGYERQRVDEEQNQRAGNHAEIQRQIRHFLLAKDQEQPTGGSVAHVQQRSLAAEVDAPESRWLGAQRLGYCTGIAGAREIAGHIVGIGQRLGGILGEALPEVRGFTLQRLARQHVGDDERDAEYADDHARADRGNLQRKSATEARAYAGSLH